MSAKRTLVEIAHDEGYGEHLLLHINSAFGGKDMRAERIVTIQESAPPGEEKPKQFLLFAGYEFYPRGGWEDLQGWFSSVEEAIRFLKSVCVLVKHSDYDWAHIVDMGSMKPVMVFEKDHKQYETGVFPQGFPFKQVNIEPCP